MELMLCIKIFLVRIVDVSLGTFRTIVTIKGKKFLAAAIGFFEVLIWFLIAREALNDASNSIFIAASYALGFASGTYIGAFISERIIKGTYNLQVISDVDISIPLRNNGYAVSKINFDGQDTQKYMFFIEVKEEKFKKLKNLINEIDPKAFIVISETKEVHNGYFQVDKK